MAVSRRSTEPSLRTLSAIAIGAGTAAVASLSYYCLVYFIRKQKSSRPADISRWRCLRTEEDLQRLLGNTWDARLRCLVVIPFLSAIEITRTKISQSSLKGIGQLSALKFIDLAGTSLTEFPSEVAKLPGLQKLKLAKNGISVIPGEIGFLSSLTDLDISHNRLTTVPPELGNLLKLKYLNLMCNQIESVPDEIGQLLQLYRLGLKGNKLRSLPGSVGGLEGLVEIFLTDNFLEDLPAEFGKLSKLVKVQASFNKLKSLPPEMGSLQSLEFLRVAVNELEKVPESFIKLNRLAWSSLAGNAKACAPAPLPRPSIASISMEDLVMGKKLGDGASGEVFAAEWGGRHVAVKKFKAETSPDGHSRDEKAIACTLDHPNLTRVVAVVEDANAIVMDMITGSAMADKPNFEFLLRCRWKAGESFQLPWVLGMSRGLVSALAYLHSLRICHGDIYAHNVVADVNGSTAAVLCDFGAAFCYRTDDPRPYEAHEVRAFGLMLQDILQRLARPSASWQVQAAEKMRALVSSATDSPALSRPSFQDILHILQSISAN